jgi:SAM-dependent methyltransferase
VTRAGAASGEAERLHRGGPPGAWGNLGLWIHASGYAAAAAALADAVADAAQLHAAAPGARVACLACGAGDELLRLLGRSARLQLVGVERDDGAAAQARQRLADSGFAPRARVHGGPALDWLTSADERQPFDAMLCVDAAYHLRPRERLFAGVHARLRPGGRFAFTDLTTTGSGPLPRTLRAAAALCGVDAAGLADTAQCCRQLEAAGFVEVQARALDAEVLDGFARFVRRQTRTLGRDALHPAWARVAITAALIGPCRRAGLGYALFSARRPGLPPTATAATRGSGGP